MFFLNLLRYHVDFVLYSNDMYYIGFFLCFFLVFLFIFERETETECEWEKTEREGDTESETGSRL